jgi:hypothetical protein
VSGGGRGLRAATAFRAHSDTQFRGARWAPACEVLYSLGRTFVRAVRPMIAAIAWSVTRPADASVVESAARAVRRVGVDDLPESQKRAVQLRALRKGVVTRRGL